MNVIINYKEKNYQKENTSENRMTKDQFKKYMIRSTIVTKVQGRGNNSRLT